MKLKLSCIAIALLGGTSFHAAAETLVPGSSVTVDASIAVSALSTVGLQVTPTSNLAVNDLKDVTKNVATLTVKGDKAAMRIVDADPTVKYCKWVNGQADATNKAIFCLSKNDGAVDLAGITYYKFPAGDHHLRPGAANNTADAKLGADTYTLSLEAVQYTK